MCAGSNISDQQTRRSVLCLCSYNLESGIWNTVPINSGPVPRYGHSLAAHQVNAHARPVTSAMTEQQTETHKPQAARLRVWNISSDRQSFFSVTTCYVGSTSY